MTRYLFLVTLCSLIVGTFIITYASLIHGLPTGDKKGLHLTPLIEAGKLDEARKSSEVKSFIGDVKSHSGLLTVDKKHDSNLFFWYFPSERKAADVPLLVWLNGFSTPSTYGVFLQTGPYSLLTENMTTRPTSWQKYFNVIYIDSPVGVGYSFTKSKEGYSTDLEQVTLNLQKALEQFYELFPDLKGRELYLTGLSMGGKYIPGLAHRLYKIDSFNLKGFFLGNPLLDFDTQMTFENYLWELGLIDRHQQKDLVKEQDRLKAMMKSNDLSKWYDDQLVFWLTSDCFLCNMTGIDNIFDYEDNKVEWKHFYDWIEKPETKDALHVTGIDFHDGTEAMKQFAKGIAFSTLNYIGEMADSNKIKMMFYAGQDDVSCAYPMMVDALMAMNWSKKADYNAASRSRLYQEDGKHIWGYSRNVGPITDVMVRWAGHSAVTSQPERVLWLLKQFTDYKRFE